MTNQVRVARSSSVIDLRPKYKTTCIKSDEEPNRNPSFRANLTISSRCYRRRSRVKLPR